MKFKFIFRNFMNNQFIKFSAEPPATRWTYFKTALIIFVATQIANFFAQSRLVQKFEWKLSFIVCTVLSLLVSYFLSRSPLTKSLTIDYGRRLVIVGFATLTKADNSLEIPFERLSVKTDASADTTSQISKWKTSLLLDGREVYLLLSGETGFTPEQMNEFNERVQECQKTGKIQIFSGSD